MLMLECNGNGSVGHALLMLCTMQMSTVANWILVPPFEYDKGSTKSNVRKPCK
jgi:hypothetical protein